MNSVMQEQLFLVGWLSSSNLRSPWLEAHLAGEEMEAKVTDHEILGATQACRVALASCGSFYKGMWV